MEAAQKPFFGAVLRIILSDFSRKRVHFPTKPFVYVVYVRETVRLVLRTVISFCNSDGGGWRRNREIGRVCCSGRGWSVILAVASG